MARLRAECAWKAEQTHRSLARYLLEESYELLEAIDVRRQRRAPPGGARRRAAPGLFHAAIAEEEGRFTIDDVAAGLREKLDPPQPHVFGDEERGDAAASTSGGRQIKARRSSAPTSSTASRPPSPPCCAPTRSSTGSSGPAARRRWTRTPPTSATGCWSSYGMHERWAWIPSRRSVTPLLVVVDAQEVMVTGCGCLRSFWTTTRGHHDLWCHRPLAGGDDPHVPRTGVSIRSLRDLLDQRGRGLAGAGTRDDPVPALG